jgi:hypothetical protein
VNDLGVAGTIGIFTGDVDEVEEWQEENPDAEIIELKFTSVAYINNVSGFTEIQDRILVVYRKE